MPAAVDLAGETRSGKKPSKGWGLSGIRMNSGKVRKRKSIKTKRRKLRGTVVKMIAVMESNPESMKDPVSEFLVTGRTGRRNAMADILGPNASVTSGDLPKRLESLTTVDRDTSSSSSAGPSMNRQPNEMVDQETKKRDECQCGASPDTNSKSNPDMKS